MGVSRLLSEAEYKATFAEPMRNITNVTGDYIDVFPYVRSIPTEDLQGHVLYDEFVECVYRSGDNRFDHVLVMTKTKNVYLVVVVDLNADVVQGHRLLDLNKEYGLS